MGRGRLEGIIPFIILFVLLFYLHSKLYDLFSYFYGKLKKEYIKRFPAKPKPDPEKVISGKDNSGKDNGSSEVAEMN